MRRLSNPLSSRTPECVGGTVNQGGIARELVTARFAFSLAAPLLLSITDPMKND
jgi:hypothetical protein